MGSILCTKWLFVVVILCVLDKGIRAKTPDKDDVREGISNIKDWKGKSSYYFDSIRSKIQETFDISSSCSRSGNIKLQPDYSMETSTDPNVINIASFPPDAEMYHWWKNISRPQQMRQEPLLCEEPYTKRKPLFEANGCQLPTYMHPSAPRCQSKILKEICSRSKMEKNQSSVNGFVLPEADHAEMDFNPPSPFIITARRVLVTMCGQIIHPNCGLVHLSTSCQAPFQYEQVMFV